MKQSTQSGALKKLLLAAVVLLLAVSSSAAQTVLRLALPTLETHPRNQALTVWAGAIKTQSKGQLAIVFHHGVTDYPGARIPEAVADGVYEIGVPGWWHLSRYAPDYAIPSLPMFYGREIQTLRPLFDGSLGAALQDKLEQALHVQLLGKPLDLGFGQVYTTSQPVKTYANLKGLNIRVPGSGADLARYLLFEATPRRIGVHDLADALQRQLVGGLLATHNFVADAALWKVRVRHGFIDNQVFYHYTPIINRARWETLLDDEREWLVESWAGALTEMRQLVASHQAQSRAMAARSGIKFVEVPLEERRKIRGKLLGEQNTVAKALKIDPGIVELARSLLDAKTR